MNNLDKFKGELQAQPEQVGLEQLIQQSVKELGKALPSHLNPERLVRIALTCIRLNPDLAKCTPASFLGALFTSAQLGLEPVAGNAYLLPFNNKRQINGEWKTIKECQFIIGYKGLANLFYRHEKAVQLNWGVVREKDDFNYEYGTNSYLKHKPARTNRGELVGFYVIAELSNGGKSFMYMSYEDCMEHGKKHSKTYNKKDEKFLEYSPWFTNPEAMCLKTTLIQLAKLLPLSIELQRAISADETSREYRSGIDTALDLPDNTNWQEPQALNKPQIEPQALNKPTEEPKKAMYKLPPEVAPNDPTFTEDDFIPEEPKPKKTQQTSKNIIVDLVSKLANKDKNWSMERLRDWLKLAYQSDIDNLNPQEAQEAIGKLTTLLKAYK